MAHTLSNNQLLIKQCIEEDYADSEGYDSVNTYFEYFASKHILKDHDMSNDEIESGIIGGGLDGGCDAIYTLLNNEIVLHDQVSTLTAPKGSQLAFNIIQAKYTHGFNEDAIMKWKAVCSNLLNISNSVDGFVDRYNEDVRENFTIFRDSLAKLVRQQVKLSFHFYYATIATEVHPNVCAQSEELKGIIKGLFPAASVDVTFVGADELMALYNSDAEVTVNLEMPTPPISTGDSNDFVALVNLATYYKFITDDSGKLHTNFFEANVRDYQGKNSVNSGIAESLADESSDDFWWHNNGVTILSEKVTLPTYREMAITNPEIVNGLQTSNEIYNYYSTNPAKLENEKRKILVRIIVPSSEESRDKIIAATNSQTAIPKSSLRVTDPIHLQIEMYFKNRGLYYDRRKNYYSNQHKKASDIIGVSFLAQCLISILLQKPDYARARPSTLLTDDSTYHVLYEENQDLEVFYKCAAIGKMVKTNLKNTQGYQPAERSDILFYLLYAVVAKTVGKSIITVSDIKNINIAQITDDVINNTKVQVYENYIALGGNGRVAKSGDFLARIVELLNLG